MRSFLPRRTVGETRKSTERPARPAAGPRSASAAEKPPHPAIVQDASRVPLSPAGERMAGALPGELQGAMEAMSGVSLADVEVHRNSAAPRRLGALAFTKGNKIHLAPGQDRHLAHEAWHVVQQKTGRVKATRRLEGEGLNDDAALESEADAMSARAANFAGAAAVQRKTSSSADVVQRLVTPGELDTMDGDQVDALVKTLSFAELRTLAESLQRRRPVELARPAPLPTTTQGEQAKPSTAPSETGTSPPSPVSQTPVESVKPVASTASEKPSPQQTGASAESRVVGHRHLWRVLKELGTVRANIEQQLDAFQRAAGYRRGKTLATNPLYGNLSYSLYPVEGQNPTRNRASQDDRVHRPILDIEIVGRQPYARTFLGLYAPDPSGKFKDITSDDSGKITLKDVGLMNLGNPMKALLWCEDYLSNKEHEKSEAQPKPVVRSWLIPLAQAEDLLLSQKDFAGTRPVDQDRGSGQFSNKGQRAVYDDIMQPLIGSLVSFFYDAEDYKAASDKGQRKFGLADLQEQLTGRRGDPREFAQGPLEKNPGKHPKEPKGGGMAAQHGRGDYQVKFRKEYQDPLAAYYSAIDTTETGFSGATESKAKHRKSHLPEIFDDFPLVKKEAEKLSPSDLSKGGSSGEGGQLPEAVNRLRTFARAYLAIQPVGVPGPGLGAPGNSGNKPSDKDVSSPPSKHPEQAQSSAEQRPPPISQPEPPKKVEASPTVPPVKSDKQDLPSSQPSAPVSDSAKKEDKSERQNPDNQYAVAQNAVRIPSEWFRRLHNPGGGDCLYHALEERTLTHDEMLTVRAQVAQVRHNMPDTPRGRAYNANVAAATITQSPALWELAPSIEGRHDVPNAVLAMMQSIPTVYAGTEELIQWCRLRNRRIHVIDHDGTISTYTRDGHAETVRFTGSAEDRRMLRHLANSGNAVYKSPGHWEHILGPADIPQAQAAPKNNGKK